MDRQSFAKELRVLIRGAGEMASGIAHRLVRAGLRVCLTEIPTPLAVRRGVAFCEAVYDGQAEVEGIRARLVRRPGEVEPLWDEGIIPLIVDPEANIRHSLNFQVLVDAILAKKNLGTRITDAPLVIAVGPGFEAGLDAHAVIESNRGHNLGRVIYQGKAEANTGIPAPIDRYTVERVLRAPRDGLFKVISGKGIGDRVQAREIIAQVADEPIETRIGGVVRGLLRDGLLVKEGTKLGDIDPRGIREYCFTISDKARAIAGGVLEAIMHHFNR